MRGAKNYQIADSVTMPQFRPKVLPMLAIDRTESRHATVCAGAGDCVCDCDVAGIVDAGRAATSINGAAGAGLR